MAGSLKSLALAEATATGADAPAGGCAGVWATIGAVGARFSLRLLSAKIGMLGSVELGTGRTAIAIDAGTHSCALLDNGAIKCWGPNERGALGQGDTAARGDAPGELGDALPAIDLGG